MIALEVLVDKLGGMEAGDIAHYFYEEGVSGYRSCASNCPVSNWLSGHGYEVSVGTRAGTLCHATKEIKWPPSVVTFIMNFDHGLYGELRGLQ